MIGATKAIKTLIVATAAISSMSLPAYSQHFTKGSGGRSGPPVARARFLLYYHLQ